MPRFRMYPLRANNVLESYQQRSLIDLDPPYQRLSIWDTDKQRLFIDSIVNGVDTPKLYFHDLHASGRSGSRYRYSVIDGKQRILALWAFISDELPLPDDFVYFDDEAYHAAGMTYSELLRRYPILRAKFDAFELPVVLVNADSDDLIEQLFARLNVQVPLSAAEARNVLGGPLPLLIRKIALSPFFQESVGIRNNRFQHHDLAAKLLFISYVDAFVSTKKRDLDNFVLMMKTARGEGYELASSTALQALEEKTKETLHLARTYFGEDSPLLRSVGRTTLYFHLFRLCDKAHSPIPMTLHMLEKFNADVTAARQKSQRMSRGSAESLDDTETELVRFDQEKQSVNDAGAIERQYGYLKSYMESQFRRVATTLGLGSLTVYRKPNRRSASGAICNGRL